ncbi:high affinity glucose transporter [Recurvomyces mirabilis]|uniref:High affinity glucose transporter n=1 Tax=Recurvomyces mirabilis TaxID=574656 RepID=A0AAE0WXW3_9PEZI|nr:high affinity glucose transporter [Recurvomyces mirabilis]KAK5162101.1 high affinity glucose transporter [Recurvomyces mirabilis]
MKKFGNVYLIAAISIIGGGLFGFDISSMSAIIATQPYLCYFNQGDVPCTGPTSNVQGGITASMAGGSWLASLCSGFVSDRFGRKRAIMLGAVIWVIGCIIVSASQNIAMLIVGRVINGFCVGICSAQVPVYISEIAPPSKRGRLVGAQQWAITWGIMIMFFISYGCSFLKGTGAFRVPWALQMIPAIVLFFGMTILPESPRWLASKDRWDECRDVLVLTHGHGDVNSPWVAREFAEIKEWIEIERQSKQISYLTLFTPRYINRTHIGLFTQIWSQLTGMNVMMYYITYVFTMAGLTGNTLLVSSSIQYVINVVMTVPALIWIDRVGRRPTLLVGSCLMATWLFVNAGILGGKGTPVPGGVNGIKEAQVQVTGAASKAVIACSYLFVASYAPTWGPVSWIYPPELYPNELRGKAVAFATSGNWAFNFALGYFVPPAFETITWRTYIVFGVFCVAMTIHVFFMFPETAGKPLEEVTEMFEDPAGIKYIGTPAWKTKNFYSSTLRMEGGDLSGKRMHSDDESPERREATEPEKIV